MLEQSWSMRVPDFFESLRVVFGCGIEFIDEHACAEIPHILFSGPKKVPQLLQKTGPQTAKAHYRPSPLLASFSRANVDPFLASHLD